MPIRPTSGRGGDCAAVRGASAIVIAALLCLVGKASGQCEPVWTHPLPTPAPSVRTYHSMVYDSERARVVLFGGTNRNTLRSDLWEWDGSAWALVNSSGPGGGRRGMVMSDHRATGMIHLFGGITSAGVVGGTWGWDGAAWTEAMVPGPSPRADSAMVYDAARGQSVLFGGWGGALSYFDDTWIWDGLSWTHVATAPESTPHARGFHSMAYDRVRGRVVLFGGLYNTATSTQSFADTWEWDGAAWTRLFPTTSPPARAYHAMAFDGGIGRTVLFGGFEISAGNFNDTWTWDGFEWTHPPTPAAPSPRIGSALVYDGARGNIVLFGGQLNSTYFADTWSMRWENCCAADFNRDGSVDFFDYDDFVACFEGILCPGGATADFNADGSVDFFDYDDFVLAFEAGC